MEFTYFFFLTLLFGIGYAWPWHHKSASSLIMERARNMQSSIIPDTVGTDTSLCKSTTLVPIGSSKDTALHICRQGNGACFFSALASCCEITSTSVLIGSTTVTVGRSVEIRYFTTGGFGSGTALDACFSIPDSSVEQCKVGCDPSGNCIETSKICQENVVSCDPVRGCICKVGFMDTDEGECCQCDFQGQNNTSGIRYHRDGDQCLPICDSCLNRNAPPDGRCTSCRNGFQPPNCCSCAPNQIIINGRCEDVCVGNVDPSFEEGCTETSCTCKRGFTGRTCCNCTFGGGGTDFFMSSGSCRAICSRNADEDNCNRVTGCSKCANNFSPPDCCNCTSGRELEIVSVEGREIRRCVCPADSTDDGTTCTPCSSDKEVVDNVCVCKDGTVDDGEGGCKPPCHNGCLANRFNTRTGCSQCKPGFEATPLCCDCTSPGYIRSGDDCLKVCEMNVEPSVKLGCTETSCTCKEGFAGPTCCFCSPNFFGNSEECRPICTPNVINVNQDCDGTTGCSRCANNFSPADCCNCASDRKSEIIFVEGRRITRCVCKGDAIDDGTTCTPCAFNKVVVNNKCECRSDLKDDGNGGCTVPCVNEQDLFFVVDPSASFNVLTLRTVVRTLQLVVGELNDTSEKVRVAIARYPIILTAPGLSSYTTSSKYIVRLDSTCTEGSDATNDFSYSFNTQIGRSDLTRSYAALNFLANSGKIRSDKKTAIIMITDSNSEGYDRPKDAALYAPTLIRKAVSAARKSDKVMFLALGVNTAKATSQAFYTMELQLLSDNIAGQMKRSENEIIAISNAIIDLLEENGILCLKQANNLRVAITSEYLMTKSGVSSAYASCIQRSSQNRGGGIEEGRKCSSVCHEAASTMLSKLEETILKAVEQVLGRDT